MKKIFPILMRWMVPGFGSMLFTAAFFGALLFGPRMMNIDGDLGRHITIGRYILNTRSIPTIDLFSHTMAGQPLTPHEWLSQVIFALSHAWMGLDGVVLVAGVVIAASFGLLFGMVRGAGRSLLPAVAVTVLAMAASSLHWLTRPHIFTFLMLVFWLKVLVDLRAGKKRNWWLLPFIMLVWANLHGAFIAGFVVWAIIGTGTAWDAFWHRQPAPAGFWRSYLFGGLASLIATLANPSGIGLWATSTGYIGNRYLVGHTAEYLPPNFHEPVTWPFLLMIGLLVLLLGLRSRRVDSAWVMLSAAWLVMALYSARNIPLFAIVSAPLLAVLAADLWSEMRARSRVMPHLYEMDQRLLNIDIRQRGWILPLLVLILAAAALNSGVPLDSDQRGNTYDPLVFPVQAAGWLEQHPQQGNMFNHFPWGGYLLYRHWPERPVFIDGQTDFYGENLTRQYEKVLTLAPGWEDVLDQYHVDWVIIPTSGDLAGEMRSSAHWETVYRDDTAVIFNKVERP